MELDQQIDRLASELFAIDEAEARAALRDLEAQIAHLNDRASRLRAALQLRDMWGQDTTYAMPSGGVLVPARVPQPQPQPAPVPKTRDALRALLREQPSARFDVKTLRAHLARLGINITPEAVRQALRRLVADGEIVKVGRQYQLPPPRPDPTHEQALVA